MKAEWPKWIWSLACKRHEVLRSLRSDLFSRRVALLQARHMPSEDDATVCEWTCKSLECSMGSAGRRNLKHLQLLGRRSAMDLITIGCTLGTWGKLVSELTKSSGEASSTRSLVGVWLILVPWNVLEHGCLPNTIVEHLLLEHRQALFFGLEYQAYDDMFFLIFQMWFLLQESHSSMLKLLTVD